MKQFILVSASMTPSVNASNLNVFFAVSFTVGSRGTAWHSCHLSALKEDTPVHKERAVLPEDPKRTALGKT